MNKLPKYIFSVATISPLLYLLSFYSFILHFYFKIGSFPSIHGIISRDAPDYDFFYVLINLSFDFMAISFVYFLTALIILIAKKKLNQYKTFFFIFIPIFLAAFLLFAFDKFHYWYFY